MGVSSSDHMVEGLHRGGHVHLSAACCVPERRDYLALLLLLLLGVDMHVDPGLLLLLLLPGPNVLLLLLRDLLVLRMLLLCRIGLRRRILHGTCTLGELLILLGELC